VCTVAKIASAEVELTKTDRSRLGQIWAAQKYYHDLFALPPSKSKLSINLIASHLLTYARHLISQFQGM
jgi:hypothetical protein